MHYTELVFNNMKNTLPNHPQTFIHYTVRKHLRFADEIQKLYAKADYGASWTYA